jgi:uncharacterized membrane protein
MRSDKFFIAFVAFAGVPVYIGMLVAAILYMVEPSVELLWTTRILSLLTIFIIYKAWQEARKP